MRVFIASILVFCILAGIGFIFWFQEWQFMRPTPKPQNYSEIKRGDSISAELSQKLGLDSGDKVFLHFYNYDCPCSRFNITEFRDLVIKYDAEVKFLAILETVDKSEAEINEFKKKYGLGISTYIDKKGEIAAKLGVYSTPQAVLIKNRQVFYNGNYNKARFCTTQNTKFANLALEAMMKGKEPPIFPELATVAYGCELPANGNKNTRIDKFFNFLQL